jgi:hypothetical protein
MSGSLLLLVAWSLPIQRGPDLLPPAPRRSGNRPRSCHWRQTALTMLKCEGPLNASVHAVNRGSHTPKNCISTRMRNNKPDVIPAV